jgi:hypothetical protein
MGLQVYEFRLVSVRLYRLRKNSMRRETGGPPHKACNISTGFSPGDKQIKFFSNFGCFFAACLAAD